MQTVSEELMEIVGPEAMRELCTRFGGTRVYIPHRPPNLHAVIVSDFDRILPQSSTVMSAYEQVAEANGVATRTVRRLVNCGQFGH